MIQEDLTVEQLSYLVKTDSVAVDCEMTGLNPSRDKLCLVQLCDAAGNVIILKNDNWESAVNFRNLVTNSTVIKVFHFAVMDCAFLLTKLKVEVINSYCTKIASKIARTYTQKHGLADLVQEFFNIKMDKNQQSSFWCAAELNMEQLEYAKGDVIYLLALKKKLEEIMVVKGFLPTGISYIETNAKCQQLIPVLVQLFVNGWDFGKENQELIFGR